MPNSRSWGNRYTRICTWARLIDREGRGVYVFNTHWDHESQPARERSATLMLERIRGRKHQRDPFILMGDLNATPDNPAIRTLLGSALFSDPGKLEIASSSHWSPELRPGSPIDYIFTSKSLRAPAFEVESNPGVDGHAASDHHPVRLRLTLP